jgi:hypothetical protein
VCANHLRFAYEAGDGATMETGGKLALNQQHNDHHLHRDDAQRADEKTAAKIHSSRAFDAFIR